jgi:hypothetical protein
MKLKKKLKSLSREDAKKWWKGNAKFVFALVSAFFVIVSFAVKDDYRDHVKSLADSIDRAEDTFVLTAQNQRIYNLLGTREGRSMCCSLQIRRRRQAGS